VRVATEQKTGIRKISIEIVGGRIILPFLKNKVSAGHNLVGKSI
jgi:hypothetical protein